MTVVRDIALNLEIKEVLRRSGIGADSKVKPEMEILIEELLSNVNDGHLLTPAMVYEIYPVTKAGHHQLSLGEKVTLRGSRLASILSKAKELAVVVCTIGPRLEEKVTEYFDVGEPLRGLLLDGIGTAAVDSLAREACQLIANEALLRGYQASSPLSPGGTGFPISEQRHLFELVSAAEIGVTLSSATVMIPRKSVSMVIGIGLEMKTWTKAEACARCNLSETCSYRIGA